MRAMTQEFSAQLDQIFEARKDKILRDLILRF